MAPSATSTRFRKAVSLRDFTDVWAARSPEAVDDIYAPTFEGHGFPLGRRVDRARYKTLVRWFQRVFPDCEVSLERLSADDDHVYAAWTFTGTHENPLWGVPPSGATVEFAGTGRHSHVDGEVTEVWLDVDWWGLYRQILQGYGRAALDGLR